MTVRRTSTAVAVICGWTVVAVSAAQSDGWLCDSDLGRSLLTHTPNVYDYMAIHHVNMRRRQRFGLGEDAAERDERRAALSCAQYLMRLDAAERGRLVAGFTAEGVGPADELPAGEAQELPDLPDLQKIKENLDGAAPHLETELVTWFPRVYRERGPDAAGELLDYAAELGNEQYQLDILAGASRGEQGSLEELGWLLARGADPDADHAPFGTMLHQATCRNDVAEVRVLLEHGADPDVTWDGRRDPGTPLHVAAEWREDRAWIRGPDGKWVEYEPDMHGDRSDVFRYGARGGNALIVRLLLEAGANPNARDVTGTTPLQLAAFVRNRDVAELLIAHNADANATDQAGWNPLHWAATWDEPDLVRLLLEHGSDPGLANAEGDTPLHRAALWGRADVVELLVRHGASVEAPNELGQTPLATAAIGGDPRSVALLLRAGADAEALDADDRKPLHHAARQGWPAIAAALQRAGAKATAVDAQGMTPPGYARKIGAEQMAEAMENGA